MTVDAEPGPVWSSQLLHSVPALNAKVLQHSAHRTFLLFWGRIFTTTTTTTKNARLKQAATAQLRGRGGPVNQNLQLKPRRSHVRPAGSCRHLPVQINKCLTKLKVCTQKMDWIFIEPSTQSASHPHIHTHWRQQTSMQGAGPTVRSHVGVQLPTQRHWTRG